jgi:putative ABC transport system permease protein
LRALNIDLPSSGLVVSQNTVTSTIVIGLIVTVLSAILPARRAGKVPPLAAMRATALEIAEPGRKRLYVGLGSIALGIAIIVAVVLGASNTYLGLGILFVFIGTIVLGPIISRPVALFLGRPAARFRGITGVMARQNSARNPKRTSRTASPVLIGVALVTAVTALAASIKGQINDVFTVQFKGDYAVTTDNQFTGGLSPSLALDLNNLPEVEKASGIGLITVKLNDKGQYFTTIDPGTVEGVFDIGLINATYSDLSADSIFLSESYSIRKNLPMGSKVNVTLGDATQRKLTVRGLYEFDELAGNFVVNRAMIAKSLVNNFDIGVYIVAKNGISDGEVQGALEKAVKKYGQGELLTKQEYINKQSGQVNQLLGLIYGLLMLSIVIAFVGIIITLLLSVFERQRELGLLRAVGMTRSQVRTTVRWESVITSLLGAVLGIILGIGLGWIIVFALKDQGLTSFKLPVGPTIIIMIMSFIVGLFAAIYPAWRATRVNILDALNTN